MAGSVNKVILIGNLGADPEIRRTQDGRPVANLRLATSESWKDKTTGERKEKTEWHRVVIFNENLCRIAEQYLKKGSKVFIEGALQTRKWQDQSGQDRYSTEVVLQGFRGELTLLDRAGGAGAGSGETASVATVSSAAVASSAASSNSDPAQRCRTISRPPPSAAEAATQFAAIGRPVIAPRCASTSLPRSVPAAITACREISGELPAPPSNSARTRAHACGA